MTDPELMDMDFEPPTRGRPPLVNVEPVIASIKEVGTTYGHERWLAFRTYSDAEVRSLRRQLTERGYEATVSKEDGRPVLYARWGY